MCLSAPKQNTEVITPFRVAAVMCKNGIREQNLEHQPEVMATVSTSSMGKVVSSGTDQAAVIQNVEDSGETTSIRHNIDTNQDVSASETLLRMEDHKKQTESLLERFKNSHFFVRIAESDEPLWSRKCVAESSPNSEAVRGNFRSSAGFGKVSGGNSTLNAVVDVGDFDANASGGMGRSSVKCCSLHNGDIVVCFRNLVVTQKFTFCLVSHVIMRKYSFFFFLLFDNFYLVEELWSIHISLFCSIWLW